MNDTRHARQQRVKRALGLKGFGEVTWANQARGAGEVLTIASVQLDGMVVLDQVDGVHDPFELEIFTQVRPLRR